MYDSPEQTTRNTGNLVSGALAAAPRSPLQGALDEHSDQLGKLGELVGQLAERLVPVRNMVPQPENGSDQKLVTSSSPVVDQLSGKTDAVRYLQARISEILQDLEV